MGGVEHEIPPPRPGHGQTFRRGRFFNTRSCLEHSEVEFFQTGSAFANGRGDNGAGPRRMPVMEGRDQQLGIETRDLRVDFGSFTAVDDLSLRVPRGEIYGLIGPNGAGKTTTFRVLATLQQPTYGEMYLEGVDLAAEPAEARRLLGYMPDLAPIPSDLNLWEFLDLFGASYGVPGRVRRDRIAECLEPVDLVDKRNTIKDRDQARDIERGR